MSEDNVRYQSSPAFPSNDERLFALLSHLSLILGGIILPVIIWATQKNRSQFVRFHSLQAIFYQIAYIVIIFIFVVLMVIIMILLGGGLGFLTASSSDSSPLSALMIIFFVVFYGGMIILAVAAVVYSIYLAVKSYQGYWIRIPVIGNIIWNRINRLY